MPPMDAYLIFYFLRYPHPRARLLGLYITLGNQQTFRIHRYPAHYTFHILYFRVAPPREGNIAYIYTHYWDDTRRRRCESSRRDGLREIQHHA